MIVLAALAAVDCRRRVVVAAPPFFDGPVFGHQEVGVDGRKIQHVTGIMLRQIYAIDEIGELPNEFHTHPTRIRDG